MPNLKLEPSLATSQRKVKPPVENTKSIIKRPTVTTGFNKVKPTVTTVKQNTDVKLTKDEVLGCDIGLSQYADVMSPKFYAWYCKAWYKIGRERFHQLAAQARADGKNPARLFSSLVKTELAK